MSGARASVIGGAGASAPIELPRSRESYHLQSVAFSYDPDFVADATDRSVYLELLTGSQRLAVFPASLVLLTSAVGSFYLFFGEGAIHDATASDDSGYVIVSSSLPSVEVKPEMRLRIVFVAGHALDLVGSIAFLTDEPLV